MALRKRRDGRRNLAKELRAFFEPHHTTDRNFDDFCGWPHGTTRTFLDESDVPTPTQFLEICIRLQVSPGQFLRLRNLDTPPFDADPPATKCTLDKPCCQHRLDSYVAPGSGENPDPPCDCVCHN